MLSCGYLDLGNPWSFWISLESVNFPIRLVSYIFILFWFIIICLVNFNSVCTIMRWDSELKMSLIFSFFFPLWTEDQLSSVCCFSIVIILMALISLHCCSACISLLLFNFMLSFLLSRKKFFLLELFIMEIWLI